MDRYPWLRVELDRKGDDDLALRRMYSEIRTALAGGDASSINELLKVAKVEDLSLDLLLGMLTTTLRYHSFLPERARFFDRVRQHLDGQGANKTGLLAGLG